ncbi:MAG: Rossmann-like and DUF2520 domain-containing protein [Cyclobacteriaceae bacterium]
MANYFNISIIGSGNLAWHLAQALENAGHFIHEIYSRNPKNARKLTKKLYDTTVSNDLDFIASESEVFIIAVSDNAIKNIAEEIQLPEGAILLHTSGSKPMEILKSSVDRFGVFYPLQTFTKGAEVSFKNIPICLEASSSRVEKVLKQLAQSLSRDTHYLRSKERQQLHLAAVFACNFTNHMLTLAQEIMEEQDVDAEILHPLIAETINKSFLLGPENAQTGPALRGDSGVMKEHLKLMRLRKDLQKIYKLLSQHILEHYQT